MAGEVSISAHSTKEGVRKAFGPNTRQFVAKKALLTAIAERLLSFIGFSMSATADPVLRFAQRLILNRKLRSVP